MFKHHTKNKGDLGVLKVKCDLVEKGFLILTPESEHSPFDIVVYKNNKFKRIQIKYRTIVNGKIEIQFKSSWADKNGIHMAPIDKNQIDLYAIYCPDLKKCYYFDPKSFNKSATFRVKAPKNNQSKRINLLSDYCEVP